MGAIITKKTLINPISVIPAYAGIQQMDSGFRELVTPYHEYKRLGKTIAARQAAYRQLFKHHLSEGSVSALREATNKAWVLGSDRFKEKIQRQLARRVEPAARGGDRKSEHFKINRV